MRTALCVMAAVLLVGVSTSEAAQRWDDRRANVRDSRNWGDDRRYDRRDSQSDIRGGVHIVFSTGDLRVIRDHYEPRYRDCYEPGYRRVPPGLQKKYRRTGRLPRGWERRMAPLPRYVERRLSVLPREYRRGVFDGHAVIYAPRTGVIIDATVVF